LLSVTMLRFEIENALFSAAIKQAKELRDA
jgi:hypothetical protein